MADNYRLNKYSLRFEDKELEKVYYEYYFNESIRQWRYAVSFAVLLYILFGLPDLFTYNYDKFFVITVRYFVVVPLLILAFALTFTNLFKKYGQIIFSIILYLSGLSVILMAFSQLPFSIHFIGLSIVFIFCFNFSKLLYVFALSTSALMLLSYVLISLFTIFYQLNTEVTTQLVYFFIFYVSLNLTGFFSYYSVEKLNKMNFIQQLLINTRNAELEVANNALSEKNQLILEQNIELDELNKKLSDVNFEISKQYAEMEILHSNEKKLNQEISESNIQLVNLNEKLNEANSTKDKFFSIIAHDLKNPLTAMIMNSELSYKFFDRFSDIEKIENIKKLNNTAKNLYQLLENLLTWARSQTNKIEFYQENFNLNDIINKLINLSENSLQLKKITVNTSNIEKVIFADKNMIEAIIRNLLSNAIKFTPNGGSIEIGALLDNSGENFHIYVKDSGVGIKSEIISKLFKMDKSITSEGTNKEKGTGLGLLLCKEFVEKHKGKIWAESDLEKGATFWFSLPS